VIDPALLSCHCLLQMMELGERMIKAGVLYADDTPVDQMREVRAGLPQRGVVV
jgi:hypothetical protein